MSINDVQAEALHLLLEAEWVVPNSPYDQSGPLCFWCDEFKPETDNPENGGHLSNCRWFVLMRKAGLR